MRGGPRGGKSGLLGLHTALIGYRSSLGRAGDREFTWSPHKPRAESIGRSGRPGAHVDIERCDVVQFRGLLPIWKNPVFTPPSFDVRRRRRRAAIRLKREVRFLLVPHLARPTGGVGGGLEAESMRRRTA